MSAAVYFFSKAVAQRCSVKKVFFKISQNSQENKFFYRTPLWAASAFQALFQEIPAKPITESSFSQPVSYVFKF